MGRDDAKYRGTECLNCHTPLDISERYCHYCGQLNSTKKITLSDYIEEFFSNFYAYDSKIRNTFKYIFTKPGFIAEQIIKGRRQSFANPFRLFLSISILFFLVSSYMDENSNDINFTEKNETVKDSTKNTQKSSKIYKAITNEGYFQKKIIVIDNFSIYFNQNTNPSFKDAITTLHYPDTRENKYLYSRVALLYDLFKNQNKSEIIKSFNDKKPFIAFLILPLITLSFYIVFIKKNFNYVDHLIFVYTLATVLFIKYFIELFVGNFIQITISILFLYYAFISLRKFYNLKTWKTFVNFVLLGLITSIISIPTISILAFLLFLIT